MTPGAPGHVSLRFLGVSGFEITTDAGVRLLIDPFLDGDPDRGLPPCPIPLDAFDDVDVVMVTHAAWDHLGQSFEIARRSGARLVCGPEIRPYALEDGVPDDRVSKAIYGTELHVKGTRIKCLPAWHVSIRQFGEHRISGAPVSFFIETESGMRLFHSGDTSLFGDLRMIGEVYKPQLAMLCVGGTEPHLAPLPPADAVIATEWLGVQAVVPMHFRPGDPEPVQFTDLVKSRLPGIDVIEIPAGSSASIAPFGE